MFVILKQHSMSGVTVSAFGPYPEYDGAVKLATWLNARERKERYVYCAVQLENAINEG